MSTRSSRQVKGNKHVSPQEIRELFDSDDNEETPPGNLTDEQIEINKKLSDSGLLEDGLGWNEKKALVKTLNASVSSADYERRSRNSPKTVLKERIIPIEVEDEDEGEIVLEKGEVAFVRPTDSVRDSPKTSANKSTGNFLKRSFEVLKNNLIGISNSTKKEVDTNPEEKIDSIKRESNSADSYSKCNKVNVDVQKNEKFAIEISSDEDGETIFFPRNKRRSPSERESGIEQIKKLKMDQSNNGSGSGSGSGSSSSTKSIASNHRKPLKTETEWAAKQNSICFNRRSVQTILNELQRMNKLRKEASRKYSFPVRWGNPIMVRNSSERWDAQSIPQKLIDRYQRFMAKNRDRELLDDATEPGDVSPTSFFRSRFDKSIKSHSSEDRREKVAEELQGDEPVEDRTSEQIPENSENVTRQSERRIKGRNGNRHKLHRSEDDDLENVIEDDENDGEWMPTKQAAKKNGKLSGKILKNSNTKNSIEPTRRQHLNKAKKPENKVENYKFYRSKNLDDVTDGNDGEGKSDWSNREVHQEASNFDDPEEIGGAGDDEQVPCPICNKFFKQNLIESHATECASKTFQD